MGFVFIVIIFIIIANPPVGLAILFIAFLIDYFFVDDPPINLNKPNTDEYFDNIVEQSIEPVVKPNAPPVLSQPVTTPTIITHNQFMSNDNKKIYLRSDNWKQLKQQRAYIFGNKCEACGIKSKLELHHITYVRLGAEQLDDVRLICGQSRKSEGCHSKLHEIAALLHPENPYGREFEYPLNLLEKFTKH